MQGGRFAVRAPSQTISYLSCHDDWTLWDKLVITMDPHQNFDRPAPEILRANRLAAALCFGCQGHWFLLSGEEFGRTKQGLRDSFQSPAALNRLDWTPGLDLSLAGAGRVLPGPDGAAPASARAVRQERNGNPAGCGRPVARAAGARHFCWTTQAPAAAGPRLLLLYNADKPAPCGGAARRGPWQLLADGTDSFAWQTAPARLLTGQVTLPAGTATGGRADGLTYIGGTLIPWNTCSDALILPTPPAPSRTVFC